MERDPDRRASIHRAVGLAEPGDVVVIAGKGHEQGQEFADGRKEPFDDVAVAREALRARAHAGMRHWSDQRVAGAAGAELVRPHPLGRAADGPARAVIDSRAVQPGDLFVGLPGERVDGGSFAAAALAAGAWGVLVDAGGGPPRRLPSRAARCWRASCRCRRWARWPAPGGATSRRT